MKSFLPCILPLRVTIPTKTHVLQQPPPFDLILGQRLRAPGRLIQQSPESLLSLATRHGVNPKTVAKWCSRTTTADAPMGPKLASTVLSAKEEAIAVAFRQHTQLQLDDCLYALQETIPHLSRSALHRLFQRHGISRLPAPEPAEKKMKFKGYPLGYLHVDFAEVHTEEGRVDLFVAIDRTSKLAFAELQSQATIRAAGGFLRRVLAKLPYRVHTVLTDNGIQFGSMRHQPWALPPCLTASAPSTASNTSSRNPVTLDPTARASA